MSNLRFLSSVFLFWRHGFLFEKINLKLQASVSEIATYSDLILKVKTQRDKYWAHQDKKYFDDPKKLFEDFPVSLDDLMKLNEFAKKILKSLNSSVRSVSLDIDTGIFRLTTGIL